MGNVIFMEKGTINTAPVEGIMANNLPVGTTVKLLENGGSVEYIVAHQGRPRNPTLYDNSCVGTWLILKNYVEARAWDSTDNDYKNSDIHQYLSEDYYNRFDDKTKEAILTVNLPYVDGNGSNGVVKYGENGLSANVFLLSNIEVGGVVSTNRPFNDGGQLSYFVSGTSTEANTCRKWGWKWWLRSPYIVSSTYQTNSACAVTATGSFSTSSNGVTVSTTAIRPALVIRSTAFFDSETMILRGVGPID